MNIIPNPSPNFNDRPEGMKPSWIILHYTETLTAQEALDFFDSAEDVTGFGRVSAHYVLGTDGTIYHVVDEDKRAWHAGKSHWQGLDDMNSHSIGIEIVNGGHAHDLPPYPETQMHTLVALLNDICTRNNIPKTHIIGHSDVAPERKRDPGPHFDWDWLAEQGFGQKAKDRI